MTGTPGYRIYVNGIDLTDHIRRIDYGFLAQDLADLPDGIAPALPQPDAVLETHDGFRFTANSVTRRSGHDGTQIRISAYNPPPALVGIIRNARAAEGGWHAERFRGYQAGYHVLDEACCTPSRRQSPPKHNPTHGFVQDKKEFPARLCEECGMWPEHHNHGRGACVCADCMPEADQLPIGDASFVAPNIYWDRGRE